jgi:CBS domain-containing protein
MAETGLTRLPVVTRDGSRKFLGIVSLRDLLQARVRNLEAEQRRERILPKRPVFPQRLSRRHKLHQGERATTL